MLPESKTAPFHLAPSAGPSPHGVLLLHGFTGSPWELRPLGEALAARGFTVHAPRLPGHGTTPEAMLEADRTHWLAAADDALSALRRAHATVSIAGLSMGALLGLVLAARRPTEVAGLVLLAPAVRLRSPLAKVLRLAWRVGLVPRWPRWVTKRSTDLELDEARAEAPILPRYPLARVIDLFHLQDLAMDLAPSVRCPSLVLAAARDHVVDLGALEALHRRLPRSRLVVLQRGFHIIPRDRDRATAATETAELLDQATPALSADVGAAPTGR